MSAKMLQPNAMWRRESKTKIVRETEKRQEAYEADRQCGSAAKGIPCCIEIGLIK